VHIKEIVDFEEESTETETENRQLLAAGVENSMAF